MVCGPWVNLRHGNGPRAPVAALANRGTGSLEYAVSTYGFKSAILIMATRYGHYALTEVKEIIMFYPSTTQVMVDSHCEILWSYSILLRTQIGRAQ